MSSTLSPSASSAASAAAAATSSAAAATLKASPKLKIVGIILAIASGLLIGASFVFKKKGLLRSQAGAAAGEGVAYLKSPLWWLGMSMMILGELCNFAAYAFIEAIVVTPLGALSVVICAILSSLFLNEKLSLFGWLGCALCILGSTIIALNGPREESVGQIKEFQKLFLAPGFLVYCGVLIAMSLVIVFYFGPRRGKDNMLWYISVCSMIGGISVSVTTGLGAAIVTTAMGDTQFKYWFIYFLIVFVAVTLVTEVYYLNVALALFNTAMVTPTYYVAFTFCSMVTTVVLFQGLKASASQIITIVMAFFSICIGITILQMSKVDPVNLTKLDRRSTMLLQAARSNTQAMDEKDISGVEDPGMDALRGNFGAMGSIIRAKTARRMSMTSRASTVRSRHISHHDDPEHQLGSNDGPAFYPGMKRHQLFDNPVPPIPELFRSPPSASSVHSVGTITTAARNPTIKFDSKDLVHSYNLPGATGAATPVHEFHTARGRNRRTEPDVTDSVAATLGVGPRYSNFLSMSSPPADEGDGAFGRGSSLFIASPTEETRDPLAEPSAHPRPQSATDAHFHHPPTRDPYEGMPATTLHGGGFPHAAKDSLDSVSTVGGPTYGSDEDERIPPSSLRAKVGVFGRQPSPRRYPGTAGGSTDEEESVRLWKKGRASEEETSGSEAGGGSGGIRLVGPPAGTARF